jgi:ribosomal protein S6
MGSFTKTMLLMGGAALAGCIAYDYYLHGNSSESKDEGHQKSQPQLEDKFEKTGESRGAIEEIFEKRSIIEDYDSLEKHLSLAIKKHPNYANNILRFDVSEMKKRGIEYDKDSRVLIFGEAKNLIEEYPESALHLGPNAKEMIKGETKAPSKDYVGAFIDKSKGVCSYVAEKGKKAADYLINKSKEAYRHIRGKKEEQEQPKQKEKQADETPNSTPKEAE